MFEKLSQSMKGNQNARKNPLAIGSLATVSTAGLAMLGTAARRVADSKAAINDIKLARKYKSPSAKKIISAATKQLKTVAVEGLKSGAKRYSPIALGLGVGTTTGMYAAQNRKKIAKALSKNIF